jgi:hypothetical protein
VLLVKKTNNGEEPDKQINNLNKIFTFIFVFVLPISLFGNHPYNINLNKDDDNLRGKVSVVIEQIKDFGIPFIIVKRFNEKGMLVRANYYEQNDTSSDLNLDTTNLFLARFEVHEYKPNKKLLNTKAIDFKYGYREYNKQNYYNTNDSLIAIVTTIITKDSIEKDSTNIYYSNYKDSIEKDSTNIYYSNYKDSIVEFTVNNTYDTVTKRVINRNLNGTVNMILTKEINKSDLNRKEYYFDKKGNLITLKETEISEDESDICENSIVTTYIYDEYSRIIYAEFTTNINSTERKIGIYEYDINGLMSSNSIFYYSQDLIQGYSKSTLDENNNYKTLLNEYSYIDNNLVDIISEEIIYKYKFDKNWNWTESKEFRKGAQENYKKRIIKYFD